MKSFNEFLVEKMDKNPEKPKWTGGANPAGKPKIVKQSDVSKKAAEFTKDYNKTKKVSVPKAKTTSITPEMKAKTFKQSFGKPTGADPKTGKGTYKPPKNIINRSLYVDPKGKVTERGIDKYISNRNTKGKFKGADIKPETVAKGLEQTKKDIKNPEIRKSTASQIKTKYGGRRAQLSDPWNDTPNMKTKTPTPKTRKSIVDLKPPKGEIIGGPTGKADRVKVKKSTPLRSTAKNTQGMPADIFKQMQDVGYDKAGSARHGYTGSFRKFKKIVKDNRDVTKLSKNPAKTAGGKLVTASSSGIDTYKPTPKISMGSGSSTRSAASKMTKYPKIGKNLKSTWATRGFGKQAGALFGVSTGINKYKQEIKKGKSKASAATSATLKGGASGLGSYAGALIGRKFLGKPGMMVGSAIGSSIGSRAYEIGNNLKNVTTKSFKNFRKKSPKGLEKFTGSDAYKKVPTQKAPSGKKIKSFGIAS